MIKPVLKNYIYATGMKSILNTKTEKIPERLIFKVLKKEAGEYIFIYRMASKKGKYLGEMKALPAFVQDESYYPNMKNYFSFYIKLLKAKVKNQKVGTDFLKLAKKESYRANCDGKVHLFSVSPEIEAKSPPSIFYRKNGFSSKNISLLKAIDRRIKNKNVPLPSDCSQMEMYLPVNLIKKK